MFKRLDIILSFESENCLHKCDVLMEYSYEKWTLMDRERVIIASRNKPLLSNDVGIFFMEKPIECKFLFARIV